MGGGTSENLKAKKMCADKLKHGAKTDENPMWKGLKSKKFLALPICPTELN